MTFTPPALAGWLYRRAENVAAAMLAVMFAAFVLQIAFRYLFNLSTGWTQELSLILWIWLVLWGAAFVVREEEEIRFDLVYGTVGPKVKRVLVLLGAAALIFLYGAALLPTYDYVAFMKVEKTAALGVRFDWLFSIYVVFVVATLVRYFWLAWGAMRGTDRPSGPNGAL